MKKALLLCASHNDLGLMRALRKLGYEILVTGKIPNLIGEKYADKYIQADYSDKELVLSIAKKEKIDVICPCCNDFAVYTAAYVAEQLGLPGYDSYETTLALHNKDKFKKFAGENNILSPRAETFNDLESAVKYIEHVKFPVIIKPTDASAGNGVRKVENTCEAKNAIKEAFENSRIGIIVIEPFIIGTQHGLCTFLREQKVVACCSNNEYSIINPYRVEIDTYPADDYDAVSTILIEQIEKIADLLKLKDGIFHLQYIMDGNEPRIIEVMRRAIGNMYSVPANLLTGIDWDYWEVRARCGLSCTDFPVKVSQEGYYAYKALMATKNGRIEAITIPERYKKYIIYECMIKKVGSYINRFQSEPVGFLFFMFSSQKEMKHLLIDEYDDSIVKIK